MGKPVNKIREYIRQNTAFCIFLLITVFFLFFSIIWVYHVKVLNAPKVYSDGFGYYLYLPAVIHNDFSFGFAEGWEHPVELKKVVGGQIDKYPVGVAILESPFFFLAHAVCLARDALTGSMTATGYSNLYQYMVLFGGAVYWMAGTILLYELLRRYLGFSEKVSLMACIVLTYGTNLFHYASYDACFSHVYSYFLFCLFLWYLCWYEEREETDGNGLVSTCVFGLLAGLIFMCRNTNLVFVLTYIFYGVKDWQTLKKRMITILRPARALPILAAGFVSILPQLFYWYSQTGHWIVYSYGADEPFYWLAPQILNFLFSVRKGLFFWNPILLLAVAGIFAAHRKQLQLFTGLIVFLFVVIYLSSAWWCWYYAGAYGQRVAVDFMCLFAVFMAALFDRLAEWRARDARGGRLVSGLVYGYCGICIVWNLWCMIAYWYRVLPTDEANWSTIRDILGMLW